MNIETRTSDLNPEVAVIALNGRLDMDAVSAAQPAVLDAAAQSKAGVILDLSGLESISSAGLRLCLRLCKEAEKARKRTALVGTPALVYKVFKVSSLDSVFHFFDDEKTAIEALWS